MVICGQSETLNPLFNYVIDADGDGDCFFWYRPTWVVPDKGPLNGCCVCVCWWCRNGWQALLAQVEARDQKLHGAGELHRFNRDVEDALSRMQEKYASIPEELGRDLRTVQSYIKKHEGFENDLVALEAQVCEF